MVLCWMQGLLSVFPILHRIIHEAAADMFIGDARPHLPLAEQQRSPPEG